MIICKKLNQNKPITTLKEWELAFYTSYKAHQWKQKDRSAYQTAIHWLLTIPVEFNELIKNLNIKINVISPEHITPLDDFKGNSRNHDLCLLGKNTKNEPIIICIESKVDEPFGKEIGLYYQEIQDKKAKNLPSNADSRIDSLCEVFFKSPNSKRVRFIKYQLLTAIAGTIAEAEINKVKTAYFFVQTFLSNNMDSKKHRQNQRDLDYLIKILSNNKVGILHSGEIVGPFNALNGSNNIPKEIDLYIGKYSIKI